MPKPSPIPAGYHTATPYLIIKGAANAIEFYKRAFGATVTLPPIPAPGGRVGHAELRIGDSPIMLADEFPEMNSLSPQSLGGTPISIHLYVENSDKVVSDAVAAGATVLRPIKDQFYGDRSGAVTDPFGHIWHISTHVEDVAPDELRKRADVAMQQMQQQQMQQEQ
ncbi:MAG: VOC family protein [Methylobacteriaceae bacterium]|nr:VOC family protein [Methylobacteriaceae bacterium]MBV9244590.1 VOC family protein [Methylobacteriaceae bacterium]MBV9636860.1 VOC family protein [Methylobacteriaceae bacterium]MBV9702418.1 VOC family protein [Methylobacteriaceae bacterium]